jgi:hypothetical protein
MMKTELMMLLAMIAVCTSPLSAKEKFPVAEVDQICANPDQYNGNILALHGIAGTVALESSTFTVLDSKSSNAGGSSARFIRVTIPEKSQMVVPAPGQEVVVVGKIVNRRSTITSVALQIFTNPADIQKILAQDSKTRSGGKRPGDIPGRNTKPAEESQ